MVDRLRLIVYLNSDSKCSVFERIVDFDSSVSVPFESLKNDMRFLFGKSCKVVFEL